MKIYANKFNSAIKNLANTKAILLYGANYGLVDILKNLVVNSNGGSVISIYADDLKQNNEALFNEVASVGLFADDNKIIIVKNATDSSTKYVKECLDINDFPANTLIIVTAGELPASSSLRKLFEPHPNCIATACYLHTAVETKNNIKAFCQSNKLEISADNLDYLTNLLSQDALIANNMLQALLLYIYPNTNITLQNITSVLENESIAGIDQLVNNLFLQNIPQAYQLANKLLEDFNPVVLVKSIYNNLYRLHLVKSAIENGFSKADAIKLLNPPIFFANVSSFENQLQKYSLTNFVNLLHAVNKLEINIKLSNNFATLYFKDFILNFKQFT